MDGRARWVTGSTTEWVDKRYGLGRRVPVFAERKLSIDIDAAAIVAEFCDDPAVRVRKAVASSLVDRSATATAAELHCARRLANDKSPAVARKALYVLKHAKGASGA